MDLDFRGIFTLSRLRKWWNRTRLRAARLQLEQISHIVNKQEKEAATKPTGDKARDLEMIEKWKRENKINLFSAVGQALSLWAQMEESLVVIAGMLLRTKFTKAGAVLYSIINFNVWLNLIDELFTLEPSYDAIKPKWGKVAEKLKRLNDTRVRLAHHTIHAVPDEDTLEDTSLRPGRLDSRRKSLKHQPMNFEQILAFIHSVAGALEDLTEIVNAMTEIVDREP